MEMSLKSHIITRSVLVYVHGKEKFLYSAPPSHNISSRRLKLHRLSSSSAGRDSNSNSGSRNGFWRRFMIDFLSTSKEEEEDDDDNEEEDETNPPFLDMATSEILHVSDPVLSDFRKEFVGRVDDRKDPWNEESEQQGEMTRRRILGTPMFMSLACMLGNIGIEENVYALTPAIIDASKAPSKPFDATDERLRDAASIFERALNAPTVVEEEGLWTEVIEKYQSVKAEWVSDIVSRAYGNRGNARSRQGRLDQALEDYEKSIILAPYAVDPVLNRGVVLESLGRYDEASADYIAVLRAQPDDPAAWNNLGNVKAAQNRWDDALKGYAKAVELAPAFSFAAANYALALYQVGKVSEAVKQFRNLLRKYPEFPDVRAALAVSLYAQDETAEAENNWQYVKDGRYKDRAWVKNTRRWPPRLVDDLERFLDVRPSRNSSASDPAS